jgi:hypothetical protein
MQGELLGIYLTEIISDYNGNEMEKWIDLIYPADN